MVGDLFRSAATVVWLILVGATLLSWYLGSGAGVFGHLISSILIIVVAIVKIRLVGMYFMELRDAPRPLRLGFDAYCLALCLVLIGLFAGPAWTSDEPSNGSQIVSQHDSLTDSTPTISGGR